MRSILSVFVLFLSLAFVGCASTAGGKCANCEKAQSVVASVQKQNAECSRLTIHCSMGGAMKACASTSADKVGKPSDKEDVQAVQTNQPVVLDENGAVDVTVPIAMKDGKPTIACGVTLKGAGMTKDQAVTKATAIAKSVESSLGGSCECCCSGGDCCK